MTSQGLRFELRDQTQKAHKRLDAALIKHDLTTVSGLSAYLSVHYLAGKHLETITLEPDCHKDISRKISAIEADLDLLSVSSPDWKAAPQARNCHPLGLTYVIAGSALGSKLLFKSWSSSSDANVLNAKNFMTYSKDSKLWNKFLSRAEKTSPKKAELNEVIEAANHCFGIFEAANAQLTGRF